MNFIDTVRRWAGAITELGIVGRPAKITRSLNKSNRLVIASAMI